MFLRYGLCLAVLGHWCSMVSARVSDFAYFGALMQIAYCVSVAGLLKWPIVANLQRLAIL